MLQLKPYQQNAIGALDVFFDDCLRLGSIAQAFANATAHFERPAPYQDNVPGVPSACFRIPTGGGKTLLGAHSIRSAGSHLLHSDAFLALWLTPTDIIREQTLLALEDVRHPYREALAEQFGDRIRVCALDNVPTISPTDVRDHVIIVVSTVQALNVSNTTGRNVYAFYEAMSPHFNGLPPQLLANLEKVSPEDLQAQPYLTAADVGRVKHSIANWMSLQHPVVIVDEAHNNRTPRFFETLARFQPSCIIDLTATPVPGNNVLYHVGAHELKAADMIKLPVILSEHPNDWEDCIADAVRTRDRLEILAQSETEYIRPIVLIQAQPRGANSAATFDVVKAYLTDTLHLAPEQIAVATGNQRDLDGIDLFATTCPIRFVITVEALKEGWDCSFAYVLASIQSVESAKDVEQLLGRVLRMPYATSRQHSELNQAYAHVIAPNFSSAASALKDRMVRHMGFDRLDLESTLLPRTLFPSDTGETAPTSTGVASPNSQEQLPDVEIHVAQEPDLAQWPPEVRSTVQLRSTMHGTVVVITGTASNAHIDQVQSLLSAQATAPQAAHIAEQFNASRAQRRYLTSPAKLGQSFAPIPQLCLPIEGHLETVEPETMAAFTNWRLADQLPSLESFVPQEHTHSFAIDTAPDGARMQLRQVQSAQLHLDDGPSHVTEQDLVRWLERQIRNVAVVPTQMQAYLVRLVSHLTRDRHLTLTRLARSRFDLAQAIEREIKRLQAQAMAGSFQLSLFEMRVPDEAELPHHSFRFEANRYPARNLYRGAFQFQKHFYDVIHDLRDRTNSGEEGEEYRCALEIEALPEVRFWVRNIDRERHFAFWLPTASDRFYPDFVAELHDGRILVVEYKGEAYATNDDSREKAQVGARWEGSSNGRCLFLMAVKRDDQGRNVAQQLRHKLDSTQG